MKLYFNLIALFFSFLPGYSQQSKYPQNYFISPVNFPLALAGNFGEIRPGHFHAGIDIKTQQVEGKPILAAADGYISRINVSLYGYGKAIYIKHPNGYTTVYAHLQRFNDTIAQYVLNEQYARKSFTVELYPPAGSLKVKQGDVIALSGNTGGSGGPHLHFEIRESATETPVNPLLFGFNIKDTRAPEIKTLGVYPLNEVSHVQGKNEPQYFPVTKSGSNYAVNQNSPITLGGKIGFGVEVNDYLDAAPNRCGAYSVLLTKNNVSVYEHQMEKISFAETRYINTHVDYYAWNKLKKRVQRSFHQKNNQLSIYTNLLNKGQLFFLTDTLFNMQYIVTDAAQNRSILNFQVKAENTSSTFKRKPSDTLLFTPETNNVFKNETIEISIPQGALYDDLYFNYSASPAIKNSISEVYHIQDLYTPLQQYIFIKVKLDSSLLHKFNKILAVSLDENLEVLSTEGRAANKGYFEFKTRSFGPYTLMIDTIAPTIKPINIYPEKNMQQENVIQFKIADELSGIKSFNGYIDGDWHVFEFDKKTGLLFFEFPQNFATQKPHQLKVVITDDRQNTKVYETTFIK